MDPRIGKSFLNAGIGYGGGCLPKDVRGLAAFADQAGVHKTSELLMAVDGFNTARRTDIVRMVGEAATGVPVPAHSPTGQLLTGKRIAVWGAAFKPGTDDVRDSPGLDIACRLHDLGAHVTIYDPLGMGNALEESPQLTYADSALEAARDADAILVATAWPEFAGICPFATKAVGASMTIVDACQGISNSIWREAGWKVLSLIDKLVEASPPPPSSHSGRPGQRTTAAIAASTDREVISYGTGGADPGPEVPVRGAGQRHQQPHAGLRGPPAAARAEPRAGAR